MTDKILIDRSVVEQAVKALDLSYALLESAKSMHCPTVLDAYKAIRAALDAKPNQVGFHLIKTDDDLVQRLNTEPTASQFLKAGDLVALLVAERKEAAARIEDLVAERQTYISLAQNAGSDRVGLMTRIEVLEAENKRLRETWLEDCARLSAERSEASTRIVVLDQALNVAQDGFRQLYRSGTTWSGQNLCREHFNKINAVIWK